MTTQRYSEAAIVLHWLVAAGIVVNVALAWLWPHLHDAQVRPVIDIHKSIGITVLGLALLRLLWRLTHRPPAFPAGYGRWERATSHAVHALLYLLIFVMPLTGWIMDSAWKDAAANPMRWFGLFQWPRIAYFEMLDPAARDRLHQVFGTSHVWGSYVLYALVVLHIAGALKHQLVDGADELQRMTTSRRRSSPALNGGSLVSRSSTWR